jgi:hypothetical protein
MKSKISIFIFIFIFSFPLLASLPLRGQGTYKWVFFNVYDAKLWGESTENLYSAPMELELAYKRNFRGEDIVKRSESEVLHAGVDASIAHKMKVELLGIFPDVKTGDTIKASFDPVNGITFYLNSTKELGRLKDVGLSKIFLDIWLGEKSSDPKLRNKLLGKSS